MIQLTREVRSRLDSEVVVPDNAALGNGELITLVESAGPRHGDHQERPPRFDQAELSGVVSLATRIVTDFRLMEELNKYQVLPGKASRSIKR